MRLPNGFGSVHKLQGNRRNPYRVRKTRGWKEVNGRKIQEYQTIGYFKTKEEGLVALANFAKAPYSLEHKDITFEEVYNFWSKEHYAKIVPSARRIWTAAYHHSECLAKIKFRDIRIFHLENAIRNATVGNATKSRMKSLYNMMYQYAIKHEIVDKNYATFCETPKIEKQIERMPFTNKEINLLWKNIDIPFVDMILIDIYSGWRPGELIAIKGRDVNLKEKIMMGGIKTEAGKNREVPIHSKIYDFIVARCKDNDGFLFCKENGSPMSYDDYRNRFRKIMQQLGMNHKPHDARHTFVTLAKRYHMDEYILKLIVGHSIQDITERIYTHRTREEMRKEIEKIK